MVMPEIDWGGRIFVAPLGVLNFHGRINLVDAARFVSPLVMERIICLIQGILDKISVCT